MLKRSASTHRSSLSPSLKRIRSSTSQAILDATPDKNPRSEKPRGRKSLVTSLSLDAGAKAADAPSNAAIRRRMNPESLAGRLGPELVQELESLLKPGMTEMPSFAVRQEIQQRYGIDRRHIYDWFHNKGLRVTTSEKREERRAMRAQEHAHMPTTRNQAQGKKRVATDSLPSSVSMPILRHTSPDSETSTPDLPESSISGITGGQLSYETVCSMRENLVYSLARPGDYADMLYDSQTMETATDPISGMVGQLPTTLDCVYRADTGDGASKAYVDRTSHWILEQQKIPYSPILDAYAPLSASGKEDREILDAILPFHSEKVLPQHQREACYRSLSEALPPACGIEECVGTYKAFMSRQGQKYYERLVSGYSHASRCRSTVHTPASSSLMAPGVSPSTVSASASLSGRIATPRTQALGSSADHCKWAPPGGLAHAPVVAPSPSQTPALSESATTASSSAFWSHDGGVEHRRERSAASCIDIAEILESPVLRSRHATQVSLTHASPRYGPAGIDPAFSSLYGIDAIGTPVSFTYTPPTVCYDYNRGHHYTASFSGSTAPCAISAPHKMYAHQTQKTSPFDNQNLRREIDIRGDSKGKGVPTGNH